MQIISTIHHRPIGGAVAAIALVMPLLGAGAAAAADVELDGFAGPVMGLATSPNGGLLVADGGVGIVPIDAPASGAPIVGAPFGAPGVQDASVAADGAIWVVTGAGAVPQEDTGQAVHRYRDGVSELSVNLFAFEEAVNPDGKIPFDSNPVAVRALPDGSALVADAGSNSLLRVGATGDVSVANVFPDEAIEGGTAQPTPTSIAIGADGSLYVGELKGFPGTPGNSRIWQLAPDGSNPEVLFDGGFTSIMDLEIGPDGRLYVAELDEASWLAAEGAIPGIGGTVNACDLATLACEVVAGELPIVTGITFDGDGSLWAVTDALAGARVVRLTGGEPPVEEPSGTATTDLTLVVPDLDPGDPGQPGDGDLRIQVASSAPFDLGRLELADDPAFLVGRGELTGISVVDARAADPGWNVSGQLTEFWQDGSDAVIGADRLGWEPNVVSAAPDQAVVPGPPVAPGAGLAVPRQLARAAAGAGLGAAELGAALELRVPTSTPDGDYIACLVLTVI